MYCRIVVFTLVLGCLVGLLNCGHEQQLAQINIQPKTEIFGAANIPLSEDANLQVQLTAMGVYIHPPATKDITSKVTWSSNTPDMVTVNATGLIKPTGTACGDALITATVVTNKSDGGQSSSGAQVTDSMTASVICPSE